MEVPNLQFLELFAAQACAKGSFKPPKCQNEALKRQNSPKKCEKGIRLDASDWENLALRTAPAALQDLGVSRSGRHSAFKELFWALSGGTACLAKVCLQKGPLNLTKLLISRHQHGGDFSPKKCSFYKGQSQILTLGLLLAA